MAIDPHATPFLPRVRLAPCLVASHLNCEDHSSLANFGYVGVILEVASEMTHMLCERPVAYQYFAFGEDLQSLDRGGTRQGIACKAVRMQKGVELDVLVIKRA